MTKNEVLKQVYDLAVDGNFNHEGGWSFAKFRSYVEESFNNVHPVEGFMNTIFMEIKLPDGWWFLSIMQLSNGMWDYYIYPIHKEDSTFDEEHTMRDKFKVIFTKGYDDGYYWDYRIWFAYDGKEYTYMNEGSLSGYIECAKEIAKGIIGLPEGYRDSKFSSDVAVNREALIRYVEMLQGSGENEI